MEEVIQTFFIIHGTNIIYFSTLYLVINIY